MTQKVIYISFMRLTDKVQQDWFVDHLRSRGAEVEYWDVVPLLFGGDKSGSKQTEFLRTPGSYREIRSWLRLPENRGAKFIMMVTYEGRTARLHRLLSKHDCRMFFIAWGEMPLNRERNLRDDLNRVVFHPVRFLRASFNRVKATVYMKLKLVKPYDVVFAAGRTLMSGAYHALRVVPINLIDYDHYVRAEAERIRITEGRYAAFLDINLPFQTDLQLVGFPAIEPRGYYDSLNRFFSIVEKRFGLKVVIAAHPKADYGTETFQGREFYRGMTAELVRDADFVISHHSASISYPVLNRKPLVFIYTNKMVETYKRTIVRYIRDFADYLDAACYNIDEINQGDQIVVPAVNEGRYQAYKYNFITSPETENAVSREIFWRELAGAG